MLDGFDEMLTLFNGLAGAAALVNSLLMWPTIKYLKGLEPRIESLEKHKEETLKQAKKRRARL
jgi:hypothetical protein